MKIFLENKAEDFLEKNDFNVIKRSFVKNKEELSSLNSKIKFPWVMKVISKKAIHKKKSGGVVLNINSIKKAEKAFDKLKKIKEFQGVLVQKQISGGELILGLKKTPEFDSVIMLGKGGTEVEKTKQVTFRVVPIQKKDAKQMMKELNYKEIKKFRKKRQIIKNLLRLSKIAEQHKIKELDINPLVINKKQAVVADARIVFET